MSRGIRAPANLPELVKTAFARARGDGDLHYFPTQVTILPVGNVPVRPSLTHIPHDTSARESRQSQTPID